MSADPRQRLVVAHSVDPAAAEHEVQGNLALARWLAEVQKLEFGGRYEPELHQRGPLYLVPTRTLVGRETAVRLGVNSDEDLLGGFVEHAFIAGKAIVHPLPRGGVAPEGWNPLFAEKVRDVVLNGVSVFSLADAHRAGARMLAEGPVRAKLAEACGGLGQYVAHDLDELDGWLGGLEERQLAQGLVLEVNLESIVTHSVGQLRVNGFLLSYHGHQHQTRNARGELVYAGSDLLVARGGYAELLALDLAREVRQAIEYARIFDTAAAIFFPGCFASRRNYDIAQGRDGNGRERFGVLEQSWRVGGASSAEIAALEAFRADPGLPAVRAASFEIHEDKRLPDNSRVIYRGPDEHGDFLLKYAMTGRHDGEQRTHPHRGRRRPDRRHLPQPPGEGSRRALRAAGAAASSAT